MSRRRLIFLIVLGLLALVSSGTVFVVATTEWGLQAVATRLGKLGPVTLKVAGVSGTLYRGAHIQSLDIEHERVHLHFTGIEGRVRLAPLLWTTISVSAISVETALIEVRAAKSNLPWTPHFLPALLRIDADNVRIATGTLVVPNGFRFDARNVSAAGAVHPKQIRIYRGELDLPTLHITTDGRMLAKDPFAFSGQASANWQMPGQPLWTATASFDGSLTTLPLKAAITAPFHATIDGRLHDLTQAWSFEGHSRVADFDIVPFGGGRILGKMSGALALSANREGFKAKGEADSSGLNVGKFDVDFDGYYADRRLTIRESNIIHQASRARATTSGTIDVVAGGRPQLKLAGNWKDFRWPLRGAAPPVRSASGTFTLRGDKPYAVDGEGVFNAADLPTMQAKASGMLDADRFTITQATVAAYGGQAQVHGEAVWSPAQSWKLAGVVANLDTAQLRSDLPGRIGFGFDASGRDFSASGDLDIAVERIEGKLRGLPASGAGRVAHHREDWRFSHVDLHLGRARLTLDGLLAAQRDLRFGLSTDDLSLLSPNARGRITARGTLSGTAAAPVLGLRAQGANFVFGAQSLRSIDADIDMDLHAGGATRGRVRLRELRAAGRLVDTAEVELDGRTDDNSLLLELDAHGLQVQMGAHGAYADGRWKGTVKDLQASDADRLKLTLESAVPLELGLDMLKLGSLCLKGPDEERLCAAAEAASGTWQATFKAERLPLRTLTAGLSQDVDYDGTIGVDGELHGTPNDLLTGMLHASLRDAQLRHHLSNGREERFAFGTGLVDASANHEGFAVKVGLDAGAAGNITGHLDGKRQGDDWAAFPITGELALETDGLGLLDVYVPGIDRAAGRLTTHVSLAGTLGAPDFQGDLQVRNGEADLYQVNLALRQITVDAHFSGNSLDFEGSTHAGDGTGSLKGKFSWRNREPLGSLHFEGENLRVVDVPEARILASPKLDFAVDGNRINVTGEVKLPQASLEPVTITNAVLSSSDEVLVGAPRDEGQRPWQVVSDLQISLGEKVNIDAYRLKARITGSIRVHTDEQQVSRGAGELIVADGKYAAFGRNLDISRGRLIFNNGPLNDPGIDLRAQKVYPDITAGVNVRGNLRAPRMTFFSEPAIPQSQIVSLILAGGSLESVQNSSKQGAARNDMLAQGGAILAQQFGSKVGIEDIGVESDLSNESALVLGKYLSPRLYVSYGIGLAEAINTVKLRYTVGDHWTIKTESGKARSADLVYTIQK